MLCPIQGSSISVSERSIALYFYAQNKYARGLFGEVMQKKNLSKGWKVFIKQKLKGVQRMKKSERTRNVIVYFAVVIFALMFLFAGNRIGDS